MALIPSSNVGGITIIVIEGIAGLLAVVTVILRIWARRLQNKSLDAGDWTCMSGLIIALVLLGSVVYDVTRGLGLPIRDIHANGDVKEPSSEYQNLLIGMYLWTASTTLLRMSTLLVYRRIFPLPKFEFVCWIFFFVNLAVAVGACLLGVLLCLPMDEAWRFLTPGNRCEQPRQKLYFAHGIVNLVFDVVIVALPMPFLWTLRLPSNQKWSLMVIFALGLGVCAMTLTRTIEVEKGSVARITTDYISVSLLTTLEPLVGVITCSLPLLRPVARKLFGKAEFSPTPGYPSRATHFRSVGQRGRVSKGLDPYGLDSNFTNTSLEVLVSESIPLSHNDNELGDHHVQYPPPATTRWQQANIP